MTRTNTPTAYWLCGLLLALLFVLPALAAPTGTVADVENRYSQLWFYPVVEGFDKIILKVTGPCNFEYRQEIKEGDIGVFKLNEETIDGIYRYSLDVMEKVDGEILEILYEARKEDNYTQVNALCREGVLPGAPLNQAGGVRVRQGKIVWDPDLVEDRGQRSASSATTGGGDGGGGDASGVPLKDFVINDDLIVDGSACIGFDCVNGESFSFDTIRLKENNLRIKFDDTSVASSFPRNDWQLTANDSANGGASKFSIDDISGNRTPFTVEANARSHSLYVDDGGRIGSRTSTPSTEIHTIDGDTPTLRLQQDGSSGFAPQTWDVAGNETNFFIRDVTNGSTLPFRIRPGAPTSALFVDVDGDVGLGTASPDASLHVRRTDDSARILVEEASAVRAQRAAMILLRTDGGPGFTFEDTGTGNAWNFTMDLNGQFRANPASTGNAFIFNPNGNLSIDGTLTTGGSCSIGCDRVFQPGYELPSIEEHAADMWEKSHLPAVGPTIEGQPLNITRKTEGILNELEKAHIYIERLNNKLKDKDAQLTDLSGRLVRLEQLLAAQAIQD